MLFFCTSSFQVPKQPGRSHRSLGILWSQGHRPKAAKAPKALKAASPAFIRRQRSSIWPRPGMTSALKIGLCIYRVGFGPLLAGNQKEAGFRRIDAKPIDAPACFNQNGVPHFLKTEMAVTRTSSVQFLGLPWDCSSKGNQPQAIDLELSYFEVSMICSWLKLWRA